LVETILGALENESGYDARGRGSARPLARLKGRVSDELAARAQECKVGVVAFEKLKRRVTASTEELHRAHLEDRYAGLDLVRIAEAPLRQPVRIGGEVLSLHVVSRADSPALEITVSDGSQKAVAVFLGRKRVAAVTCGVHLLLEGVLGEDEHRLIMLNPSYTLVPA
jgi:hypothetical protein